MGNPQQVPETRTPARWGNTDGGQIVEGSVNIFIAEMAAARAGDLNEFFSGLAQQLYARIHHSL
jgi:uncharacterized Zn-binding protein involved in type VI secretion